MPTFGTQVNAAATAMNLNSVTDTSSTSNSIGTGAKTFTVSSGKSFLAGMYLVIADTAAPSTNSMFCQVTSYSGTTLIVNCISISGSGTKTAWTISQSGAGGVSTANLQNQTYTAFTTAGTQPTYTVTTSPTYGAYAAGQRARLKIHSGNSGAASTVNFDGQGAKALKQYDSNGNKVNAFLVTGQLGDFEYDGVDFVLLDPLPSPQQVPVRQTVLSGPVDTNGLPNFGGATGSTTVTASGTLIATAANGFSTLNGETNRVGTIANPSWTGLSTNGTMYLYGDINVDGTITLGSGTLAPTYRWGGADVVTNGQFTFNIQEMVGKVGNGSIAAQTYRVFFGEVTVAGGVVTAITWYALMGRYYSSTNTLPGGATNTSKNHNIGVIPLKNSLKATCLVSDGNYAVGDIVENLCGNTAGSVVRPIPVITTRNTISFTTGAAAAMQTINKTTGVDFTMTAANWSYQLTADRGW